MLVTRAQRAYKATKRVSFAAWGLFFALLALSQTTIAALVAGLACTAVGGMLTAGWIADQELQRLKAETVDLRRDRPAR